MLLLIENDLMLVAKSAPRYVICDFFHSPHVMSLFQGMKSDGFCNSVSLASIVHFHVEFQNFVCPFGQFLYMEVHCDPS